MPASSIRVGAGLFMLTLLRQPDWSAVRDRVTPSVVEAPETGGPGEFECAAEFVSGNAPVDFGEARFGLSFVGGIILVHHVDVSVARQAAGDPAHDFARVIEQTGHDEMPEEHAAQRQAVLVHS